MRRSRVILCAGFAGAAIALALPAGAEPGASRVTAHLEVERAAGAEDCLDREALARAVERRWQRRVFVAPPADIRVEVHATRVPAGRRVRIDLSRAAATRRA